jgi:hypothetical protein
MEYTSFLYWTNWVDFVVKNYGLSWRTPDSDPYPRAMGKPMPAANTPGRPSVNLAVAKGNHLSPRLLAISPQVSENGFIEGLKRKLLFANS